MLIEARIRHRFRGFALDVELASDGPVLGVFGASGSGKTTLLMALAGGLRPDEGHTVVSGQTLYEFEKQHIFDPLGMTSTKYVLETDAERARMAEPLPSDTILIDAERQRRAHPEWQSGGGGLVSTATDYARFAQMILDGGEFGGKRYLSRKAFKLMTSDRIGPRSGVDRDYFYFPGDGFGFGYGFAVRVEPGEAKPPAAGSIGELKWDSGSGTYFGVDPKLDMVFVLMEQTQNERGRITPAFKALVYRAFGT